MDIVVCIKQVPETTDVKINKETNTLIREGVPSIINPFDMYAIEEGLRIKEKLGGKVTVVSMGPPQVKEALVEALAMGADDAVLLSDKAFAGADTLATSYALAKGIEAVGRRRASGGAGGLGVDLILCGKQAIDGDTAQVGPGIAERLGIPHVTYVRRVEEVRDGYVRVQRMIEEGYEVIESPLPALLTVVKEINEPRLPSIRGMLRARKAEIPVWGVAEIGASPSRTGLAGSATQVIRIFSPEHRKKGEILTGSVQEMVQTLVAKLRETKVV